MPLEVDVWVPDVYVVRVVVGERAAAQTLLVVR